MENKLEEILRDKLRDNVSHLILDNLVLDLVNELNHNFSISPIHINHKEIGTLKQRLVYKDCIPAEIGHKVYESPDKYIVYMKPIHGIKPILLCYSKGELFSKMINFYKPKSVGIDSKVASLYPPNLKSKAL